MKAEEFLGKIRKYDTLINNKLIEREQWKEIATNTTANMGDGDHVKSSGNLQKMEDAVCRIVDIENEINQAIDELIKWKQEVISVIEMLGSDDYDILHKIFVQYMDLQDVAVTYEKSYSWIVVKRRRALEHLQDLLDKKGVK